MLKNNVKKILVMVLVTLFLISTSNLAATTANKICYNNELTSSVSDDIDPLINLQVTVTIKEIRALDQIDKIGKPDFYVKVFINDIQNISQVWKNQQYVKPNWTATQDVPDNQEYVNITIQLWDKDIGFDQLCDISGDYSNYPENRNAEMTYSLKTGRWTGSDSVQEYLDWDARGDPSGYGRLNGCDDNTIYIKDKDCELLFEINQNDYDGDGIPYWTETNVYGTDPETSNLGQDDDGDGIPMEWEHKWGYDPYVWDDHENLDPDKDALDNIEEYKASECGFATDPFRKDILLEMDQMEIGPSGEGAAIPNLSKDLLRDAFSKHNIAFLIDDHGQTIPFDTNVSFWELQDIYYDYFLNGNESYWRRGAFHYVVFPYYCDIHPGNMWPSIVGDRNDPENFSILGDCFQVSTKNHEKLQYRGLWPLVFLFAHKTNDKEKQRAILYASAMMHETGHVLGIFHDNSPGCDNSNSVYPLQKDWWVWKNYKSVMNYGWMYQFVDYSDGSHGKNDFDDWSNIDLTLFQNERNLH